MNDAWRIFRAATLAAVMSIVASSPAGAKSGGNRGPAPERQKLVPSARVLPSPDLWVQNINYKYSNCKFEGKYTRMELTFWIANTGSGPAAATHGIKVKAYPSTALLIDNKYSMLFQPVAYGSKQLNPGEKFEGQFDMVIGPAKTNAPYYVYVQVDPDGEIKEANENNNIWAVAIPAEPVLCTKK